MRSIRVQQPMIFGVGIRKIFADQGLVLDRNCINGLVNKIHRERAKRADTWTLNRAGAKALIQNVFRREAG
jgi:hypothetical protein